MQRSYLHITPFHESQILRFLFANRNGTGLSCGEYEELRTMQAMCQHVVLPFTTLHTTKVIELRTFNTIT